MINIIFDSFLDFINFPLKFLIKFLEFLFSQFFFLTSFNHLQIFHNISFIDSNQFTIFLNLRLQVLYQIINRYEFLISFRIMLLQFPHLRCYFPKMVQDFTIDQFLPLFTLFVLVLYLGVKLIICILKIVLLFRINV